MADRSSQTGGRPTGHPAHRAFARSALWPVRAWSELTTGNAFRLQWYYTSQKILAVIVCQFKKKICNPYFIVIVITVLIMNVIFWVVNFKIQNYFVISTIIYSL
jgi:hypothetical protein